MSRIVIEAEDRIVIFVEDDDTLRAATMQAMELAGFTVRAFARAEAALGAIHRDLNGIVVSDIRMPRMDGLQLLERVRDIDTDIPVILVTGHGDVPMAVAALRDGASDFLTKPFAADHLVAAVGRELARRALTIENRRLRARAAASEAESPMIGGSPEISRTREAIARLAAADVDVLVDGETGTGKHLAAIMLHRQGPRYARPFLTINCGALPGELAALELFGHAADSVPHTRLSRVGQITAAHGGTLLLDGIEAMAPDTQASLLRVLEEREVQPIGAERPEMVNVRFVALARIDPHRAVAEGRLRADLYHRLAMTRLHLPALRDRGEDRMLLFAHFLNEAAARFGRETVVIGDTARGRIAGHDWPGNVRELRNFAYETALDMRDAGPAVSVAGDLRSRVAAFEADLITAALDETGGNVTAAIDRLGIPRKTLYEKMLRFGLQPSDYRRPRQS